MRRHPGPIEKSSSKSSRSSSPPYAGGTDAQPHADETTRVVIGMIVRPHGLQGAVVVHGPKSACEALRPGLGVRVEGLAGAEPRDLVVRRTRPHRAGAVIELSDVADRDAAAALAGASIGALRSDLPPQRPDEYYTCDIVGLEVYAPDGVRLGVVGEVVTTGANDVWVIRDGPRELLVPAVAHAVLSVDVARRRVVVDPAAAAATDEP